jgi:L-fuconolactonase
MREPILLMHIDAHQHFWQYNPQRDVWITDEMSVLKRDFSPSDLLPELRRNHVDGCVTVQVDQSEEETLSLLQLADRYPEIKGVVGWVNLRAPDLRQRLKHFSQFEKLRGFRHIVQAEPDDRYMLREDFMAGIAGLGEFNFTYDILIYPKQLPAALELVNRFPAQRFVIDHMAKPLIRSRTMEPWAEQMREIGRGRHVYCKVSGLITEADWQKWQENDLRPYLDVVIESFGPDRLMFGSDWPVCLLAGNYDRVRAVVMNSIWDLPRAQQENVLGLNAIRFYGLKVPRHEPATVR